MVLFGLLGLLLAGAAADERVAADKTRVGAYDTRSIAVAFANSRFNPVREKMADYEKAKAAGDDAKVKELQAWGEQYQRLLHFQGFGRVPVSDLLEPVKDKVAKLAEEKQLAIIVMSCDYVSEQVEVVDITEDLVKLYDPTEKTLKMALEIRKVKPASLIQLADMPADK
jgi:hypothetical protein